MAAPYIPRADGEFRDWLNQFANAIAREPWAVMLMPADAAKLVELARRYEAAYVKVRAGGQGPPAAVAEKNRIRREAWDTVRRIAMRIKRNRGITTALKIELGIHPDHRCQSRIPAPRTAPVLAVIEAHNGVHVLRYFDPAAPSRRAKPYGVVEMQMFVAVGDEPAGEPSGPGFLYRARRHVFQVPLPPQHAGKMATYFGRWVTQRGLAGPWSAPVSMIIVGAGPDAMRHVPMGGILRPPQTWRAAV
jgi:hypothetical protein